MSSDLSTSWNAVSRTGVVAAGGEKAVKAGLDVLADNGNAIDAAVTTLLALMVTDHGECSIGGEVPIMIYDAKSHEVKVLSGMGTAPLSQDAIDWYMKHGIPEEGDIKVAPVPSVVDCCLTALQLYGTRSFAEVINPTLHLLRMGNEDWHPRLASTLQYMVAVEARYNGSREKKIQAACDCFYGRDEEPSSIADGLEAFYIKKGGFLRKADLAAHRTRVEDPVTINYRGYTVCKCGPWTQGPVLCQSLRLLEQFDLRSMGYLSPDYIHIVIEALKLALADRDAYYGDPLFVETPLETLLSDEYNSLRHQLIDRQHASHAVRPGDPFNLKALRDEGGIMRPSPGGTTTCVVADRWGNMVAATPSANVMRNRHEAGQPGVTFGNRLRSFNTTPGHPNCIQPGKRPRITLTPTIVLKDNYPVLAVSVAGGDLQDQVTLNLLLDFIEFEMLPEQAVRMPRFVTSHHQDSFDPNPDRNQTLGQVGSLVLNMQVAEHSREDLSHRGHHVQPVNDAIAAPVMLYVDKRQGIIRAAGDPAAGRHAAGLD